MQRDHTLLGFIRRHARLTLAAACAAALATAAPAPATADPALDQALANSVVSNNAVLENTTVNLFDFWLTDQAAPDNDANSDGLNQINQGVNAGHYLKFHNNAFDYPNPLAAAAGTANINRCTGKDEGPLFGIVAPTTQDGYPVLQSGRQFTDNPADLTGAESLAYLFSPLSGPGKQAFTDVGGLFQLNQDGYYYFDSKRNYAEFNEANNAFTLYDKPGVATNTQWVRDDQDGQFFPFTPANQVFKLENGQLNGLGTFSRKEPINHYFGLTTTTRFMQPRGGITETGKPMQFNFTGDDDVWIFIDGVLVGDLGGIHDRMGLTIDFRTGEIRVTDETSYGAGDFGEEHHAYRTTTIRDAFEAAGKTEGMVFRGDTFGDNTYHTLQFFYLERGNSNSNCKLEFNLVDVPASSMTKVDQSGHAVAGAEFQLFAADEQYRVLDPQYPLGTGVTNQDGAFSFLDADGKPLDFTELHGKGTDTYVLRETKTPGSYRTSPDGHLRYVASQSSSMQFGMLVSENYWDSGVYAIPEQRITASGNVVFGNDNTTEYDLTNGTYRAVAVLLKRDSSAGATDRSWHAVTGNSQDGWTLSQEPVNSPESLHNLDPAAYHSFTKQADGRYSVRFTELPGDPRQYYQMTGDDNNAEYTIAYYVTDAPTNEGIRDGQIWRLSYKGLSIQTAARVHVTDIGNYLTVQKIDERNAPVQGATFALYRASDVTVAPDGSWSARDGATPVATQVTNTVTAPGKPDSPGTCVFPMITMGSYYLVETAAPQGLELNPHAVAVIVDEQGVHADAGAPGADDGISTWVGVGSLIDSMAEFGTNDDIDATLHDVRARRQVGTLDANGALSWTTVAGGGDNTLLLTNHADDALVEYGPTTKGDPFYFVSESGWTHAAVQQNLDYTAHHSHGLAQTSDLGEQDLTSLFTGTTIVRVRDEHTGSTPDPKPEPEPEPKPEPEPEPPEQQPDTDQPDQQPDDNKPEQQPDGEPGSPDDTAAENSAPAKPGQPGAPDRATLPGTADPSYAIAGLACMASATAFAAATRIRRRS